ncbi:hypothetical protein [Sulfobacillus thermosulfidooxidans]|uniref:hypothetical protein n=1 Tax=Sulfobacillus thermosulfidooxidans TaxID=28034 RepID=UPI000AE28B75|nr:hypothetical protein [Sulfobacillus thermosulfidooxidans]
MRYGIVVTLLSLAVLASVGWVSVSQDNASSLSFRWGPLVVTPTPPSPGFNPLTATNTELRANGFPQRPFGPVPSGGSMRLRILTGFTRALPLILRLPGAQWLPKDDRFP